MKPKTNTCYKYNVFCSVNGETQIYDGSEFHFEVLDCTNERKQQNAILAKTVISKNTFGFGIDEIDGIGLQLLSSANSRVTLASLNSPDFDNFETYACQVPIGYKFYIDSYTFTMSAKHGYIEHCSKVHDIWIDLEKKLNYLCNQ